MDPRDIFSPLPPREPVVFETSPATHLAKLRKFKKTPTSVTSKYEEAINRLWRNNYIRIFEKEN